MNLKSTALTLALLMCGASVAGLAARPSVKAADVGKSIPLEVSVPKTFGEWKLPPEMASQIVNPQLTGELGRLYSQLLTRTYVNKEGYRIMLSIAYGDDQRGDLQTHRPEVCYPAQGFALSKTEDGVLPTAFGNIEVRRLITSLGPRNEPVTYWVTVGDKVVISKFNKRLAEMRVALTGQIPDGMLFRISSIDTDPVRAFAMQQKFAADMMAAVPGNVRKQLSGLAAPATAG